MATGAEVGVGGRMAWWGWRRRVDEVTKGGVVYEEKSTLVEGRESFLQRSREGGTRTGRRTNRGTERSEGTQSDMVGGYGEGMPYGSSGRQWRRSGHRSGPGVLGEGVVWEFSGGVDGVRRRGDTRTMGWTGGGTRWCGGTGRQSGRRGMCGGTGIDHTVVKRSTGRWRSGGWGPRRTAGGSVHSMEGCRWGSFGGGTCAWRRWRRWRRR